MAKSPTDTEKNQGGLSSRLMKKSIAAKRITQSWEKRCKKGGVGGRLERYCGTKKIFMKLGPDGKKRCGGQDNCEVMGFPWKVVGETKSNLQGVGKNSERFFLTQKQTKMKKKRGAVTKQKKRERGGKGMLLWKKNIKKKKKEFIKNKTQHKERSLGGQCEAMGGS